MTKKLTAKQQQTLEKKNRIYEVAIKLFKEDGYENTNIRDICEQAGVTTGSLYNLYENKVAILNTFKEKLTEKSVQPLENDPDIKQPYHTIEAYILSILQVFDEIGADLTLVLHSQRGNFYDEKTKGIILLEDYIMDCLKHKTIKSKFSSNQLVEAIITIIYGLIYKWCDNKGRYNLLTQSKDELPLLLENLLK